MNTQITIQNIINRKNLIVCLNTYKNSSNFFTNLSKTAKIYIKNLVFLKKCCIFVL